MSALRDRVMRKVVAYERRRRFWQEAGALLGLVIIIAVCWWAALFEPNPGADAGSARGTSAPRSHSSH